MLREFLHGLVWARRHRAGGLGVPEFESLRPLLREDDVAFDVGAHGGSWCAVLSAALPRGHVYAFEALPYYARALGWTRRLLGWRNVTVLNQAVTDAPGTVRLVWKDAAGRRLTGTTHVAGARETPGAVVHVPGVTLDDALARVPGGRVRFVKCDVEGFELSVLRGSVGLIERCRPLFWCELWADYTGRYGSAPADVFEFFARRDYRTYVLQGGGLVPTDAATFPGRGDILAAPAELAIPGSGGGRAAGGAGRP